MKSLSRLSTKLQNSLIVFLVYDFIPFLEYQESFSPFHLLITDCSELVITILRRELYKKDLHDPDNHNGVITHLEPDILECEVKWALESITTNKASGGDRIPVELFHILKDDALNMPANLENSAVATRLEKVSFHSNPKERQCQRMLKLPHNCTHLTR